MFRLKRITGMAKGSSSAPVRKDEDESLVLFGELYKHEKEKEKDVNLLEPMYSVEFEAIQGNGRMFKLPSGKRDYLLPEGERNDFDWLKTPPDTPLFPSLEMEANSSKMVFQIELPILQPVRTSRFSSKTDVTSTSTRSDSPVSNSSKSTATPTTRPNSSSSNKNITKGAAVLCNEASSAYRIDKRSSYTPLTNRQQTAIPATTTTSPKATKKTSGKKPAAAVPTSSTNSVKKLARPEIPDKPVKKTAATVPKPKTRCKDLTVDAKDLKVDVTTKRLSRPPAARMGSNTELDTLTAKGRSRTGSEPATGNGTRATEAMAKGGRRVGREREQKQKFGSHAKK